MIKVGLTGGIGSGKSIVAKIFSIMGVPVYHADKEAKRLMVEDNRLRQAIQEMFGSAVYKDGQLQTGYLATKVFGDKKALASLNALVHPCVRGDFYAWCENNSGSPYVIEEAAILFETGYYRDFDKTVLVIASDNLRIGRVVKRDQTSADMVAERMRAQMSDKEKSGLADYIIKNNPEDALLRQVLKLHDIFIAAGQEGAG